VRRSRRPPSACSGCRLGGVQGSYRVGSSDTGYICKSDAAVCGADVGDTAGIQGV